MGVALVRSSSEPVGESPSAPPFAQFADQIAQAHQACCTADRDALAHAVHAGQLLRDMKQRLPHGEFLPWVQKACGLKPRRAQQYMAVARWVASKAGGGAHLTLTHVLHCIRAERDPDRPVRFSFGSPADAERFWTLLSQCHAAGDPGPLLLWLLEGHVRRSGSTALGRCWALLRQCHAADDPYPLLLGLLEAHVGRWSHP